MEPITIILFTTVALIALAQVIFFAVSSMYDMNVEMEATFQEEAKIEEVIAKGEEDKDFLSEIKKAQKEAASIQAKIASKSIKAVMVRHAKYATHKVLEATSHMLPALATAHFFRGISMALAVPQSDSFDAKEIFSNGSAGLSFVDSGNQYSGTVIDSSAMFVLPV